MLYAATLLSGILIGYSLCYFAPRQMNTVKREDQTVLVKRSKPSLRSPLQTNKIAYEQYKTKDTGLYAPVKAKPDDKEVEIGR